MTGAPLPPKAVADSGLWEGIDAHTDDGAGFDAGDERTNLIQIRMQASSTKAAKLSISLS
jgi:hypothetical protein